MAARTENPSASTESAKESAVSDLTESVKEKLAVNTSPEEDSKTDTKDPAPAKSTSSMLSTPIKAARATPKVMGKLRSSLSTERLNFLATEAKYNPVTVIGPSGVGKGTLLGMLREKYPNAFAVCVSHTTRNKRPGDIDGVHYNFIKRDKFEELIRASEFVEYADVHGNYYGTSFGGVRKVADAGQVCLLELDYQGALAIQNAKMDSKFLFITLSGGYDELEKRIRGRGGETDDAIARRLKTAKEEFEFLGTHKDMFDAIIMNDSLADSFPALDASFQEWFPHIKDMATAKDEQTGEPRTDKPTVTIEPQTITT